MGKRVHHHSAPGSPNGRALSGMGTFPTWHALREKPALMLPSKGKQGNISTQGTHLRSPTCTPEDVQVFQLQSTPDRPPQARRHPFSLPPSFLCRLHPPCSE
eukprot:1153389-Pelagomonas_calceolata.AAC.2